jgi:hypothetical protein
MKNRKITIKNKNSINLYEIEFEKQKSFIKKIPFKFLHLFVFLLLLALIGINHYFYNENFAQKFYSQNYPHVSNNQSKDLSSAALIRKSGISYISSLNKQKNIEQLNLNIKFNDWQYIKKRRDETISFHPWSDEPYRKVTVSWRGKKIKGKIRLKGVGADHRTDKKKWSFAIKLKKDNYILGIPEFAIHNPRTRGFWSECLFLKTLRDNDIIAPVCDQVDVFINGERIGIMTLTERLSTEMLERQGRKKGVVSSLGYIEAHSHYNAVASAINEIPTLNSSQLINEYLGKMKLARLSQPLEFNGEKKINRDAILSHQKRVATELFNGMLDGKIEPSEVFDVEKTSTALAVVFFWGNYHSFMLHNLDFYFNPITFKFEVLPNDGAGIGQDNGPPDFRNDAFSLLELITRDEKIINQFEKKIIQLRNKYESDGIFGKDFDEYEINQISKLYTDYKLLPSFHKKSVLDRFENNYQSIKDGNFFKTVAHNKTETNLSDVIDLESVINSYLVISNDIIYIQLINKLPQKVELTEINVIANGKKLKIEDLNDISLPVRIPPTFSGLNELNGRDIGQLKIPLGGLRGQRDIKVSGIVNPLGSNKNFVFETTPYSSSAEFNPISSTPISEILKHNSFLQKHEKTNDLFIEAGDWTVKNFIKPPEGTGLIIMPGANLKFEPDAGMLLRGPLKFEGTQALPITLRATKPAYGWAGITAMETNQWRPGSKNIFKHVHVYDTNSAHYKDWLLTGAINFYKSDLDIINSKFNGTIAEDALNIVHSKFDMINTSIENARSDGFDGDFISGTINASTFSNIGGDGIDFSGSNIKVNKSIFNNIHDKAVSVGEASKLIARGLVISNTGSGLVSKDGSTAEVYQSSFKNITHSSLMAYMKKPQYGSAQLVAIDNLIEEKPLSVIAQKQSEISVDGRRIVPIKFDIDKLYKEGYMKK